MLLNEEAEILKLQTRKETYERLQADGDEYGLMFKLRAELMRRQFGGEDERAIAATARIVQVRDLLGLEHNGRASSGFDDSIN